MPHHTGSTRRRLLVVGASPTGGVSFAVSLRELFRTRRLLEYFDVAQLTTTATKGRTGYEGVRLVSAPRGDEGPTRTLPKALADFRPDVVLLHGEIADFVPMARALERYRGKVVGWFPVNFERDANPYTWAPVVGRCDRIACVSAFGARQLERETRAPVTVVPHGTCLAKFGPIGATARRALRRQLGWRPGAFVFLSVGRNCARKGHEYALEALRLLRRRDRDLAKRVCLYLHTEMDESLAELLHAGDLTRSVWFSDGYDALRRPLSERSLARLYQAADAFLSTSLSEGFGMPLLEAQGFGLPIVATDNSAIREVVGKAGLLVKAPIRTPATDGGCTVWARPPDVEDCARLMERVVRDGALRARLSRAGLARARELTWEHVAGRLVGVLRDDGA